MRTLLAGMVAGSLFAALSPSAMEVSEAAGFIGKPAPEWTGLHWLREPKKLADLRGRVVLVRWWTEGCPFCRVTAPVLKELHRDHKDDGLVVVGVYHPKPRPRPVGKREVRAAAEELGFTFPIAVDADWRVLKRYWPKERGRSATSVSFLIDREGIIRWVHPGVEYHPSKDPEHAGCDAEYRDLKDAVSEVLGREGGER